MTSIVKLDTRVLDKLIRTIEGDVPAFVVEDGVEYGVHQEFTEAGHPSLVPAFERHTRDLPGLMRAAFEQGVPPGDVLEIVAFNIQRDWAADVNVDTGAYRNSIHVRRE